MKKRMNAKKVEVNMRLSEFEMPPMQDVLIIGKRSPIGPEAARRMVNIVSPGQYEIINVNHPIIEAIVVRRALYRLLPEDKLVALILDEGGKVASESTIYKAQLNIVVQISGSIEL